MQKLNKNLNYYNFYGKYLLLLNLKNTLKLKTKKKKLKHYFHKKKLLLNLLLKNLLSYRWYSKYSKIKINQKIIAFLITIRIKANNIFCTLKKKSGNEKFNLILSKSAGNYKINISKKNLKFNQMIVLKKFFNDFKKYKKSEVNKLKTNKTLYFFKILAPVQTKKKLLPFLKNNYKMAFITILEKKIFNGCRPKKKKRKKRQGLRIFR